jgi:hypothetical protein
MGCDFYVYIYLEIEHSGGTAYYEMPVKRGYFSELNGGYYDSDDDEEPPLKEEYQRLYHEIIKLDLTPHPPMVIYEKDAFLSHHFEDKYGPLLEKQFKEYLLKNQKYENDPNYKSDDESDDERFEDIGIPPESLSDVLKITRKEDRIRPSYFLYDKDENKDENKEDSK